jgi:predicted transcriptional regulator
MATVPFSVRLDEDVKARLEAEAARVDRSASYLVQQAVEELLEGKEFFRREMEKAIAEADKGVFISWEKVHAWMESWDTDHELPPPEPDIFPDKA